MGEQEKREQELMARVYQAEADFTLLLSELTSEEDRMEADYLYQEGVLVSEIRRMLDCRFLRRRRRSRRFAAPNQESVNPERIR